ncbi:16S rRNA (uracil(1498)-N(3))-methyltransferase [Teredinibacter waterburyi]|uniref:16S rRNA (uracil(1498)-N(3))-methyltransferase n=1 Tax=Teredinibacter waterburyi TaxID=1500538 RepID=UPI00165ED538|nr:16S rRNA (uracil(1498)-N(3))-methyltransferase [Teredinibacter waterburyi]
MNLILLEAYQCESPDGVITLDTRQSEHLRKVLKVAPGDTLKVGQVNGLIGTARVAASAEVVTLDQLMLNQAPPNILPLTLILALPRPQMIKRILQTVACMGVERICLIQSSRVEKSFWQSPAATDNAIREQLILGLEQGMATQLPSVEKYQRLRPFVEDALPELIQNKQGYIAHPGKHYASCPSLPLSVASVLAIGPEGGFSDKEVNWFSNGGLQPIQIGSRILKVETAVTALLARLYPA